jgi:hypothetical protein
VGSSLGTKGLSDAKVARLVCSNFMLVKWSQNADGDVKAHVYLE